ncbi:response regulator [Flammeovirga yaeyamensis]|uniref:histidine kinase n=1 Tax=Flammeovirga yaeyamensis TaxID=367791 RepID=A0AAX1NEK3_9BACT|nr:ATP-binding protein [Flammeovirga yaeyamensis]MBB3699934.1 signal transduction histidine kinase/DNA-binding response OmpR family regulator/ligand-binding sensor domain-containing protein [Flammeovirga yaeyamensis]NMF37627.1 response regulator [Flammeovirga yaeyamensis]QWG04683.1 response regulator [Flammeovirga yaeyamensis]
MIIDYQLNIRRFTALFLVLFFFISSIGFGQTNHLGINITKHITYNEGLSHFGVTALEEDASGLIWVGTFKGLNKYDGYEFKTYYEQDYPGLVSNRITKLFKDESNNLLIGTEKGISIYYHQLDSFSSILEKEESKTSISNFYIQDFSETSNYIACLTRSAEVILLDKYNYSVLKEWKPTSILNQKLIASNITSLGKDDVLITTNNGLYLLNLKSGDYQLVGDEYVNYTVDATFDGYKNIYVLSYKSLYIFRYDQETRKLEWVNTILKEQYYSKVQLSPEGILWLMKENNEIAMITDPQYFKNINQHLIKYTFSEDFTRLSSLLITKSGGWIGSFNQGVFQFLSENRAFQYSALKGNVVDNSSSQVVNIFAYDDNEVYVTLNSNFNKLFDIDKGTYKRFEQPSINNQIITRVLKDQRGQIWGGSRRNGIFKKKNINSPWKLVSNKDFKWFANEGTRAIAEDKYGDIWLAGLDAFYRLKLDENGELNRISTIKKLGNIPYDINFNVNVIYPDPLEDCIWLGTSNNGLIKLNYTPEEIDNDGIISFTNNPNDSCSISGNDVTCIQRLPNKEIWIGVLEGGINQLRKEQGKYCFDRYSEKDGLDDNDVMTFQFDMRNHLWIATNKGINQFDTKTKSFTNYTSKDGLVPASFEVVSTKLKSGLMIFGGNNGICYFQPERVNVSQETPKLLFGDLKIHNQKAGIGEQEVLQKPLEDTNEITLNHDQGSISIELISLHFGNSNTHGLRYRLLPKETSWFVTTSNNKLATYSLLPPGEYNFEAQTSNAQNEWSTPKHLKIIIKQAWWKTKLAKSIYFLIAAILIIAIMVAIIRFKSLEYKLQIEHVEKNKLKELDAARLKMFMNISHEFRTPLTLINGPINVLKNMFENNKDAFQHIDLIQRQSKKMFQLVEQVHEVRKADQNLLKLTPESFEFTYFISDIKRDFDQLANDTGKKLILNGEANKIELVADAKKLEVVINNLLNNAFKFTKEGDSIFINYKVKKGTIFLSVEDTGVGISKEDQKNIFTRFYQSETKEVYSVGSGIGLELSKMIVELHGGKIQVSSEIGKGTKFSVELPVNAKRLEAIEETRQQEIIDTETHEQKQRVIDKSFDLSSIVKGNQNKDMHIYYAEDNIDLRNFVVNILGQIYKVTSFKNGQELANALDKEWPDVVLSDIIMPEMDGLELCKLIKDDVKTGHIPVILLTSKSSSDAKIEGMEVGADAYITKPFDMKHLVATLESVYKNRKKIQDRFQSEVPLPLVKTEQSDTDKEFLERLYKLLEKNLTNENIDLEEFSKELYMSRSQFFRKVKALTDSTPQDIIRTYKLKKAAAYLLNKENSVNDVIIMTGFKSRTHFSKLFKDHYGVTPGKYASSIEDN